MGKDSYRVKVITSPSFEGVASVHIIQEMLKPNTSLEVHYQSKLDYEDTTLFQGADSVLILGLAYKGQILPEDFDTEVITPFTDFVHFGSFGEEILLEGVISSVVEGEVPIKSLCEVIGDSPDSLILSRHVFLSDKVKRLVEAVSNYSNWTWETDNITKVLLALYNASYKRLPTLIKGMDLQDMIKDYAPIIKGQMERMDDILARAVECSASTTMTFEGKQVELRVAFSNDYVSEVAHALIADDVGTDKPILAIVGRPTRGDDILSIRTNHLHAGDVASRLSGGGGKEGTASAFFGASYATIVSNSIKVMLEKV